jgi:hypothetical protein
MMSHLGETFIRRMAFHEVCEVLMARMMICATAQNVTREEIGEASHERICTLGHVAFDAEVGGDPFSLKKVNLSEGFLVRRA